MVDFNRRNAASARAKALGMLVRFTGHATRPWQLCSRPGVALRATINCVSISQLEEQLDALEAAR